LKVPPADQTPAHGRYIEKNDRTDPAWLKRLIHEHLQQTRFWWRLYPGMSGLSFKKLMRLKMAERLACLPAAVASSSLALLSGLLAFEALKAGCTDYWPQAQDRDSLNPINALIMQGTIPQKIGRVVADLCLHPQYVPRCLVHNVITRKTPADLELPWFAYAAIDFLEDFLQPNIDRVRIRSGGSTLFFARRVKIRLFDRRQVRSGSTSFPGTSGQVPSATSTLKPIPFVFKTRSVLKSPNISCHAR